MRAKSRDPGATRRAVAEADMELRDSRAGSRISLRSRKCARCTRPGHEGRRDAMQADVVTRGLDPRVHLLRKRSFQDGLAKVLFAKRMDCRVKPGNDRGEGSAHTRQAQRSQRVSDAKSHVDTHHVQEPNMRQRSSRRNDRHTKQTRGNAMRSFGLSAAARSIVRAGFVASIAASLVSFVVAACHRLVARPRRQHIRHGDRA